MSVFRQTIARYT